MAITRNLAQRTAQSNQENDSATATIPTKPTQVTVVLTSSQWTNATLAGKRVMWGVAYSTDGGVTWGPGTCDSLDSNLIGGASVAVPAWAYQTDTIGNFGKNGVMPSFQFSGGDMPPDGALVRLFAWPEVTISLGASVTLA